MSIKQNDKIPIASLYLQNDVVNNEPRLIMLDSNGEEWVLSHRTMNNDGAGTAVIEKKSDSWYFKPLKR